MKKEKKSFAAITAKFLVWFMMVTCTAFLLSSVTVEAASPSIKKKAQTMKVGQSVTLEVKNANEKVKWSTSNKKIVKIVSTSGAKKQKAKIQALKNGKATITATVGKTKLKVTVTIKAVKVNKTKVSVNEGKSVTLTASNMGKAIKWTSSNKNVAKISSTKGKFNKNVTIYGVSKGKTTITGKVGSVTIKINVTVKHVHKYADATCTQPRTCKCGATKGNALGHIQGAPATCMSEQRCIRCYAVLANKTPHNMTAATCQSEAHCQTPGCTFKVPGFAEHVFDHSGKCKVCGQLDLEEFLRFGIIEIGSGSDDRYVQMVIVNYSTQYQLELCSKTAVVNMGEEKLQGYLALVTQNGEVRLDEREVFGTNVWTDSICVNMIESRVLPLDTTVEFDIYFNYEKYHVVVKDAGNVTTLGDLEHVISYEYTKY